MILNERASKLGESLARCKKTLKTKADSHHAGNLRRKDAQSSIDAIIGIQTRNASKAER